MSMPIPILAQLMREITLHGQGNRVKSCGDEACEEVVVPGGDLAAEAEGIFAGAFRIRFKAMCLMVAKLAGAWSVRSRQSSSRKTMSITQWRLW